MILNESMDSLMRKMAWHGGLGPGKGEWLCVCDILMDQGLERKDDLRGKAEPQNWEWGVLRLSKGRQAWTQDDLVAAFKCLKYCSGGGS